MKKEKRYLKLGETFQEKNSLYIKGNYWGLYQCYDNPSGRKAHIFDYYLQLISENSDRVERYGVASYNTMIITLEAIIKKDNKRYYIYITPSYNYYMELENDDESEDF